MKKIFLIILILISAQVSFGTNLLSQGDLLVATRTILDETDSTNSAWTNTELRQFIQDAMNFQVMAQGYTIEKFDSIFTTVNSYLYNLNNDFYQAVAVFRKAGTQITPCQQVKPEEFFNIAIRYSDTLKLYYSIFGNDSLSQTTPKILFRPSIEAVDTLIVLYNAKPKFLTGSDTFAVNIQQPTRMVIPYIASAFALMSVSRHQEAQAILSVLGITLAKPPQKTTETVNR